MIYLMLPTGNHYPNHRKENKMHLSTNDQIELCKVVVDKIVELANKQGKIIDAEVIFLMLLEGDHCYIFDSLLDEL